MSKQRNNKNTKLWGVVTSGTFALQILAIGIITLVTEERRLQGARQSQIPSI